ncbi:MAG: 16S rRNA (cytidine(1402)-2'-O)-methyltransferase [Oscillospiraceae bacterium]|nr:16S rRNA (cytidine(1402)-2'-O)-methyltransferase [Oscillospiraceae bacterium]
MAVEKGALYIVGTPIGNLSDISERAKYTLANVDLIAAEDTRNTGLLLSKLGIKARLVAYHEHNEAAKSVEIVGRLQSGESCALVSDAGMPCISDPGAVLVRDCRSSGVPVYAVPGACAVTAALALSGFPTSQYVFEGFLPLEKAKRRSRLERLTALPHVLVFYEAPHKLIRTLGDLLGAFGDRKTALCREITKLYEQVENGLLSELIAVYDGKSPKGEYVIVVEGASKPPKKIKKNKYAKEEQFAEGGLCPHS